MSLIKSQSTWLFFDDDNVETITESQVCCGGAASWSAHFLPRRTCAQRAKLKHTHTALHLCVWGVMRPSLPRAPPGRPPGLVRRSQPAAPHALLTSQVQSTFGSTQEYGNSNMDHGEGWLVPGCVRAASGVTACIACTTAFCARPPIFCCRSALPQTLPPNTPPRCRLHPLL